MGRFQDKVAVVTGAATGIGLGIALRLGKEGARILVVDVDRTIGEQAIGELAKWEVDARLEVGDVGDENLAHSVAEQAITTWGQIDVLINNAGIAGETADIWATSPNEMERVYRCNLRGPFLLCRSIIPHMLKRNFGRIVNIASIAGKEGNPRMVPYSATKAAVIGLTKSVGKELAMTGIRVNCVTPAVVRTRILDQIAPKQVDYMIERIPMKRTGSIEEIAALATWLASEECSFSTGGVFDISGGRATY